MDAPRRGFWKRFSLRGLFVVTTLCCMLLGLWTLVVEPYRRKAACVTAIRRLPSDIVVRAGSGPAWRRWLVTALLGNESYIDVDVVDLRGSQVDDDTVAKLAAFPHLRSLTLDQTQTTDQGLAVLATIDGLEELTLTYSRATDLGVDLLQRLPKLRMLRLTGTQITDASVPELAKFPALETLFLRWTGVTDEGAANLRELAPDCAVYHHALANAEAP